jgi:hypothetical protein
MTMSGFQEQPPDNVTCAIIVRLLLGPQVAITLGYRYLPLSDKQGILDTVYLCVVLIITLIVGVFWMV